MRWICTLMALLLPATAGRVVAAEAKPSIPTDTLPVSFVNDVLPVLSKIGCNAGTCHGSASGKGGWNRPNHPPPLDSHRSSKATEAGSAQWPWGSPLVCC